MGLRPMVSGELLIGLHRMKTIASIQFDERQRRRFRNGSLVEVWRRTYPDIFDTDDVRLTCTQRSYHFFEWLAAVVVFNTTGYLSLVEKYRNKTHRRKRDVLQELFDPDVLRHICTRGVQCPDLLCYRPDFSDCFFCEVKGLTDRVRPEQEARFDALAEATGKPVYLIEFKKRKSPTR